MAYTSPHLFDTQVPGELLAAGGGWEGKFITGSSHWEKVQNSGIWPSNVWVRRHTIVDAGTERDRCHASYNSMGNGMDNGSDSAPGDTVWEYGEFYFPTGFTFAGGTWNMLWDWHHTVGVLGNKGQVPFHITTTTARGPRELIAQVRGGLQTSHSNSGVDSPNNEDFLLDSPFQFNHLYRVMIRRTLAPNGTCPQRNQFVGTNQSGAQIVPFTTGDSHGRLEIWVDDVLKVSKRRPTSYYGTSMYCRSGLDRNPAASLATGVFWHAKRALANTREELFDTILPVTADTFDDGGDSSSSGGGGGTPGEDTLPPLTGGKVRYGVFQPGGLPPGSRIDLAADRVRATGPTTVVSTTTIDKAYVYIESTATGTQVFKLVVWDDDGASGYPGTRMILSNEVSKSCPFEPTWEEITISPAVELPAGDYWLGVHSGGTTQLIDYAYDNIAGTGRSATDTYSDGTPTTYPAAIATNNLKMAVVLEGTVSGGGGGTPGDTTKPTILSAETQLPFFVALQIDEELDTTNSPDTDAFVVTVDGEDRTPTAVTVTSDVVTLTLETAISEGVTVAVDYDKTLATNKIIDLAGNEMDSFTDQEADNSILPPSYERNTAYARTVDPTKRIVGGAGRIVGRERKVWT